MAGQILDDAAIGGAALDRAVRRQPLVGHDGRSGARLERVVLADGRRLVVKRSTPTTDLAMLATGDTDGRERALWADGALDRLPPGVGHAILDARVAESAAGTDVVTVMRDLGPAVVGFRGIGRAECRRLFDAMAHVYAAYPGEPVPQACTLTERLGLLSPTQARGSRSTNPLVPLIERGWERFAEVVPPDVGEAVAAIHDRPALLATPLARRPATLIHGDLWLPNAAFEEGQVTLLDWGLATWGPPALDLAHFLSLCWSLVDATREEIVAEFRAACGAWDDGVALRLSLLAGLVELGWNKALDVTEHPDPAMRARERVDLNWWVDRARRTLQAGLL